MYFWLSRILLERMTDYAERRSVYELGKPAVMKIEISRRGGVWYAELAEYLRLLREHDIGGTQFLKRGNIRWSAINFKLIDHYLHETRSGLVLADIVASAFFAACDRHDRGKAPDPLPAFKLDGVMARANELTDEYPVDYGVKLFPSFKGAKLDEEQERIFRHSGYR